MALLHVGRVGRFAVRLGPLLCVCVLLFVPALTRISQKLEQVSHTPSFSKNIDCPPKRVTVASVFAIASPIRLKGFKTVRVARFVPPLPATLPPSPICSAPGPLRAPPAFCHV